jgi:hypothetical protein
VDVIESIGVECERCRLLLKKYDATGLEGAYGTPVSAFGRIVIEQYIRNAGAAIASGDDVRMLHALNELRECE